MAKGLPWVGASRKKPSAANNFTPPGGHPGPNAQRVTGDATHQNGPVYPSLKGEVHPDKPGTARPG